MAYITTRDANEARRIGRAVVRERLAACANIFERVNSFYYWEGRLCDGHEAVLIVKTRPALLKRLVQRVRTLHSYRVPCIVALPIGGGNPDFLSWIKKETAAGTSKPKRK
jgi:periplasmic divalent cation tolerance protein